MWLIQLIFCLIAAANLVFLVIIIQHITSGNKATSMSWIWCRITLACLAASMFAEVIHGIVDYTFNAPELMTMICLLSLLAWIAYFHKSRWQWIGKPAKS